MWVSVIALAVLVVVGLLLLVLGLVKSDTFTLEPAAWTFVFAVFQAIIIVGLSTVSVPSGSVAMEKNFGGAYTGRVIKKPGINMFAVPVSHGVEKVDVRNNKVPVKVSVMKDKTYNVDAGIEVVYDLNPDKVVDLYTNYAGFKSTVIGATVKQVVTSNNTLANSQTLTPNDEKEITDKLATYGIKVTNIYMDSYKLTNSSNFGINSNNNNPSNSNTGN